MINEVIRLMAAAHLVAPAVPVDYTQFCKAPGAAPNRITSHWKLELPLRDKAQREEAFVEGASVKIPKAGFNRLWERRAGLKDACVMNGAVQAGISRDL